MGEPMNHLNLYIIHPIAYLVAQEVLRLEADMLRTGQSIEQRIEYLQTEVQRLSAQASITMAESFARILPDSREGLLRGMESIQRHFRIHSKSGTLRELRNVQRSIGVQLPVLDPMMLMGAVGILAADPRICDAIETLLLPRIRLIQDHPSFNIVEEDQQTTTRDAELPSARESRTLSVVHEVFWAAYADTIDEWEFSYAEMRIMAWLYGRILDVRMTDIMIFLAQRNASSIVMSNLAESAAASADVFRHVVGTMLHSRIQELSGGLLGQSQSTNVENPTSSTIDSATTVSEDSEQDALLNVRQAMALLNLSRQTIHRLVTVGQLHPVRIGRAIRFERADIQRLIGR